MKNHYNQHNLPVVYVEDLTNNAILMFVGLIPSEAVTAAYIYNNGLEGESLPKYYAQHSSQLTWGEKTVAMGDYCTMTKVYR